MLQRDERVRQVVAEDRLGISERRWRVKAPATNFRSERNRAATGDGREFSGEIRQIPVRAGDAHSSSARRARSRAMNP